MSAQDVQHIGTTGAVSGQLHVHASASHVLIDDGVSLHRATVLNTEQARDLARLLLQSADVIEGIAAPPTRTPTGGVSPDEPDDALALEPTVPKAAKSYAPGALRK